jgi:hypothetical protein
VEPVFDCPKCYDVVGSGKEKLAEA